MNRANGIYPIEQRGERAALFGPEPNRGNVQRTRSRLVDGVEARSRQFGGLTGNERRHPLNWTTVKRHEPKRSAKFELFFDAGLGEKLGEGHPTGVVHLAGSDAREGNERLKHIGYRKRAVGLLVVLHQEDQHAPNRARSAVERVYIVRA